MYTIAKYANTIICALYIFYSVYLYIIQYIPSCMLLYSLPEKKNKTIFSAIYKRFWKPVCVYVCMSSSLTHIIANGLLFLNPGLYWKFSMDKNFAKPVLWDYDWSNGCVLPLLRKKKIVTYLPLAVQACAVEYLKYYSRHLTKRYSKVFVSVNKNRTHLKRHLMQIIIEELWVPMGQNVVALPSAV